MLIGCESIGMATVIRRPADLCIKIPDQFNDLKSDTMPVLYVTSPMFLVGIWKLEKGQSMLIHSQKPYLPLSGWTIPGRHYGSH